MNLLVKEWPVQVLVWVCNYARRILFLSGSKGYNLSLILVLGFIMITVKNVIGYEGLYLIDSLGNLVSLPKIQGRRLHNKYKILNTKQNTYGYVEVALSKDGATKSFLLHRLIAKHFIPNPESKPCVNHKNGIKTDNRIENLEWCTEQENTKHAYDNNLGGFKERAKGNLKRWNAEHKYIKVIFAKDGKEFEFRSSKEAAVYAGTCSDEVTRAIRKRQRVKGYLAYGLKASDCANGETSKRQSRGKPEIVSGTCIDYSPEGK